MKITEKHFKRALGNDMSFTIHRYLMSNAYRRQDGMEKAERHHDLCLTMVSALCDVPINDVRRHHEDKYQAVHTGTQQLTGYLDQVIGFPLHSDPDYDKLEPLFFNQFYRLAVKALATKPKRKR